MQSSQSAPGQITDAIRRAHPRSRIITDKPATPALGRQEDQPEENAALKSLLFPGRPRGADGTAWQG